MNSVSKSWSFLAILSLTLVVFGHTYGGREGLMTALVIVLAINSFIYFYEDRRVLAQLGGIPLEGQDQLNLLESVRRLSVKARVPTPRVSILPTDRPQAGVVGRGLTHGTILLTEGLAKKLSRPELEAVLAYQIASIKLLNTLAFAVGSFIATVSLSITEAMDFIVRLLIVEKKDPNTPVSQLFTRLAAPVIGGLLRLSIRPSFYTEADKLAAQLLGDNQKLAEVLWKLDSFSQTLPLTVPLSTAHIFIVSPLNSQNWTRFFAAQPKAEQRIRQLIGYYPI